jgi:NAD(P)-dependent dehydrogenase (short-subunit alcohol dehydrogenase family)
MMNQQTVLIAGATGNVGGGAALALAERGARVVLLGRQLERLQTRADHIRSALVEAQTEQQTPEIATLVIDFSDMASVRQSAAEALSRFPEIDGLVLSVVTLVQNGPNILPNGHELMFAVNVMGPFLFSLLLLERLKRSDGLVLHVINTTYKELDWDDLESIKDHETETAYERTKTMHRAIAGELARRYGGQISSVAFNPTFVIDKADPELAKRWPTGFLGFFWRVLTSLFAKPPAVAGEPMADLMLEYPDRHALNGALFKLGKRVEKPDRAMNDAELGARLWEELIRLAEVDSDKLPLASSLNAGAG